MMSCLRIKDHIPQETAQYKSRLDGKFPSRMRRQIILLVALVCFCKTATPSQEVVRLKSKLNTDSTLVSIAFSPDSKLVAATYGMDTTARVWETSSGVLKRTHTGRRISYDMPGLEGRSSVSFSPDGKILLVIAQEAREVRMWESETGKQYMTLANLIGISETAFSADGRLLALAAGLNGLQLIDLNTRKLVKTPWDTKSVSTAWTVKFSQDGSTLMTWMGASDDNSIYYSIYYSLDVQTGKVKTALRTPKDKKIRWMLSPDGLMMVRVDEKNVVSLWNAMGGQLIGTIAGIDGRVTRLSLSPGNKTLAIVTGKIIKLYDVATVEFKRELIGTEKDNPSIMFSPDGALLVADDKKGLGVWDVATGTLKQSLSEARWPVQFNSDATLLLTASKDRNVLLWEVLTTVAK